MGSRDHPAGRRGRDRYHGPGAACALAAGRGLRRAGAVRHVRGRAVLHPRRTACGHRGGAARGHSRGRALGRHGLSGDRRYGCADQGRPQPRHRARDDPAALLLRRRLPRGDRGRLCRRVRRHRRRAAQRLPVSHPAGLRRRRARRGTGQFAPPLRGAGLGREGQQRRFRDVPGLSPRRPRGGCAGGGRGADPACPGRGRGRDDLRHGECGAAPGAAAVLRCGGGGRHGGGLRARGGNTGAEGGAGGRRYGSATPQRRSRGRRCCGGWKPGRPRRRPDAGRAPPGVGGAASARRPRPCRSPGLPASAGRSSVRPPPHLRAAGTAAPSPARPVRGTVDAWTPP